MDVRRPAFIGIGAGRSGTTWLWRMLRRHPRIFLPPRKEIHYFNDVGYEGPEVQNPNYTKPIDWYLGHFKEARPDQICGEISPSYLWSETAPRRIYEFDPKMRLVAILRDPVSRTFSSYLFGRQKGEIGDETFEEAIERYPHLVERTRYHTHLSRYFDLFPRDQIQVTFDFDLAADAGDVLATIQEFLGVDLAIPADAAQPVNASGRPRYPRITRALMKNRVRLKKYGLERVVDFGQRVGAGAVFRFFQSQVQAFDERPRVDPATAKALHHQFLPQIQALEELLGRDLSPWRRQYVGA